MRLDVVFAQTQERFMNMLSEQRNQLIAMFPDLFSEMRTESQLLPPVSTEVEKIVNPDGSVTTRIHSSRAYRLLLLLLFDGSLLKKRRAKNGADC